MLLIGLASILYGSAMAFTQTNARLIVGYSSVAQLGFITMGIFALAPQTAPGRGAADGQPRHRRRAAVLDRRPARGARRRLRGHPRHGRIAQRAPLLATVFLIVTFAALAMPGSGNFVGEFLILLGVFQTKMVVLDHRLRRRRDGERLHARGSSSARCTTAPARRSTRASCAGDDALVLVPFIGVITAVRALPADRALARGAVGRRSSIGVASRPRTAQAAGRMTPVARR